MLASSSVFGREFGTSVHNGKAQRVVCLLANDDEPPVSTVGVFSCVTVVRARLVGVKGIGGFAEGLEPEGFKDAAFCEEFSGFMDCEILW